MKVPVHPQPWSWRVQSLVRQNCSRQPGPTEGARLGFLPDHPTDLVALVRWDSVEVDPHERREVYVNLEVVAVHLDHQRRGYGMEAFDVAIESIGGEHPETTILRVSAQVHVDNDASQRLCRAQGMRLIRPAAPGDPYDVWSVVIANT